MSDLLAQRPSGPAKRTHWAAALGSRARRSRNAETMPHLNQMDRVSEWDAANRQTLHQSTNTNRPSLAGLASVTPTLGESLSTCSFAGILDEAYTRGFTRISNRYELHWNRDHPKMQADARKKGVHGHRLGHSGTDRRPCRARAEESLGRR